MLCNRKLNMIKTENIKEAFQEKNQIDAYKPVCEEKRKGSITLQAMLTALDVGCSMFGCPC